jgi:hypothetical protein
VDLGLTYLALLGHSPLLQTQRALIILLSLVVLVAAAAVAGVAVRVVTEPQLRLLQAVVAENLNNLYL